MPGASPERRASDDNGGSHEVAFCPTELEELTVREAGMGPWQWLLVSFLSLSTVSYITGSYVDIFFLPPGVRYWCRPPASLPPDAVDVWIAVSHPHKWYTRGNQDACLYYDVSAEDFASGNVSVGPDDLVTCTDFVFSQEPYGRTLYEYLGIQCEAEYHTRVLQLVDDSGLIIGNVLFGYLSDVFGRKPPLFVSLGLQPILGLCVAFASVFPVFSMLRFLYFVAVGGGVVVAHVLLLETVGNRKRSLAAGIFSLSASIGFALLPAMSLLVDDWQKLQVIVSCPTIMFLVFVGFIPESPQWLLARNEPARAAEIILRAVRLNRGAPAGSMVIRRIPEPVPVAAPEPPRQDLWHVFAHLNVVKTASALFLLSFGVGFTARALILHLIFLVVKEMVLAFVIGSVMAFVAVCLAIGSVYRFRHHKSLCFSLLLCAFSLAVTHIFPLESHRGLDQPPVILLSMAQLFSIMALGVLYNYGARAYPTVFRGTLFGCTVACGSLGGLCAPAWVLDMHPGSMMPVLVVCGALPALCLLLFWLPPVHFRELPDTLRDAHDFPERTKPQRWTTARPRSDTYEETEIRAFDMEHGKQPDGLDFSLNRVIVPTLARP